MPAFSPDDVTRPTPDWPTIMKRGLVRRCPRCGSKDLFRTFWQPHDRCPDCGLSMAREPGFFTGVYLINLSVTEGAVFVVLMGYVLWRANGGAEGLVLPLGVALVLSLVLPIVYYPFARTTWAAIDLIMTPLELGEIVDAVESTRPPPDAPKGTPPPGSRVPPPTDPP